MVRAICLTKHVSNLFTFLLRLILKTFKWELDFLLAFFLLTFLSLIAKQVKTTQLKALLSWPTLSLRSQFSRVRGADDATPI